MSNSYSQSKCIASKQPPSKLYDLFSVLVFVLSFVFSDLVLAFKACWPFYSLLAPFHHQTATWSFSFLLTKLLQQFPWPSRCPYRIIHSEQTIFEALFLSHTSGNVHSCTSLQLLVTWSCPLPPISQLLTQIGHCCQPWLCLCSFFFSIKNVFLLFPLVFQIQPFPTITYSSHSTNHSLSSDLSWSFWFVPTVYSPFYLLCPQCLPHCLPLSRWQKHGTLKDPVVSWSLSEVVTKRISMFPGCNTEGAHDMFWGYFTSNWRKTSSSGKILFLNSIL